MAWRVCQNGLQSFEASKVWEKGTEVAVNGSATVRAILEIRKQIHAYKVVNLEATSLCIFAIAQGTGRQLGRGTNRFISLHAGAILYDYACLPDIWDWIMIIEDV